MKSTHHNRSRSSLGTTILIILAISIAFGFIFDFIVTKIEYAVYPRPNEYSSYVEKYSSEFGVPEELIWAIIKTESNFDSSAVSSVGAIGLMQLTEPTFDELTNFRLKEGLDPGMRYDPETNIRYGTYYISFLYARYGNWNTAIAAYNGGLGNVDKWLKDENYGDLQTGTLHNIPFKETANYVKKVNKAKSMYEKLY